MSNKERVVSLLNEVPEYKLEYVIDYLQGLIAGEVCDLPEDTVQAFEQVKAGELEAFSNTQELFESWEK